MFLSPILDENFVVFLDSKVTNTDLTQFFSSKATRSLPKVPVLAEVVDGFDVVHVGVGPVDALPDEVDGDADGSDEFVGHEYEATRPVHVGALDLGRVARVAPIAQVREKHVSARQ